MQEILAEMQRRMEKEVEATLFGGYSPIKPGTLTMKDLTNWRGGRKLEGCPYGCQVVCFHCVGV